MKFFVLFVVFVSLACSLAYPDGQPMILRDCPAGEHNPGPDCGLEPSCAPRSSHFIPKHVCDCWCLPGTYRNVDTDSCVVRC